MDNQMTRTNSTEETTCRNYDNAVCPNTCCDAHSPEARRLEKAETLIEILFDSGCLDDERLGVVCAYYADITN